MIFPPDGQISPGVFKNFKKKQMGHQLSEEDHEHLDLEFRLADRDGNGIIDWWEFLNYQTKVKLAMRDQVGRNTEYLPTNQNGITHIHASSLILCIHCSL